MNKLQIGVVANNRKKNVFKSGIIMFTCVWSVFNGLKCILHLCFDDQEWKVSTERICLFYLV